jgi:hypothetical protein
MDRRDAYPTTGAIGVHSCELVATGSALTITNGIITAIQEAT